MRFDGSGDKGSSSRDSEKYSKSELELDFESKPIGFVASGMYQLGIVFSI